MSYLTILECPVIFSGDNTYSMTSIDMCPSVGVAAGLVSRHVKVLDARIIAVCIWTSEASGLAFFGPEWRERAGAIWGDDYQLRLETLGEPQAA